MISDILIMWLGYNNGSLYFLLKIILWLSSNNYHTFSIQCIQVFYSTINDDVILSRDPPYIYITHWPCSVHELNEIGSRTEVLLVLQCMGIFNTLVCLTTATKHNIFNNLLVWIIFRWTRYVFVWFIFTAVVDHS